MSWANIEAKRSGRRESTVSRPCNELQRAYYEGVMVVSVAHCNFRKDTAIVYRVLAAREK